MHVCIELFSQIFLTALQWKQNIVNASLYIARNLYSRQSSCL